MPRVAFTSDAQIENAAGVVVESYRAGSVHELPIDKCRRWVRRNRAVFTDAPVRDAPQEAAEPAAPLARGASRDSGPAKPSSVSPPAPASPAPTSSTSGEPTSKDAAAPSPSAGESGPKEGASSTLHLPTSSTPRTSPGGGSHRTPKGSRG